VIARRVRTFGVAVAVALSVACALPAPAALAANVASLSFSPTTIAPGERIEALSCLAGSFCLALDEHGDTFAYRGSHWRRAGGLSAFRVAASGALACATTTLCVAGSERAGVISDWTGLGWGGAVPLSDAGPLSAVGCSPSGYCTAVDAVGNAYALLTGGWERTGGDWGSVTSIACVSSSLCFSASASGISRWDGGSWTQPSTLGLSAGFSGISCPTASFCAAVDSVGQLVRWDGRRWLAPVQIEPRSSSPTALPPAPTSIACTTASFCVAVDSAGAYIEARASTRRRERIAGASPLRVISCLDDSLCFALDSKGDVFAGRSGAR
jgi:hypothetical protein